MAIFGTTFGPLFFKQCTTVVPVFFCKFYDFYSFYFEIAGRRDCTLCVLSSFMAENCFFPVFSRSSEGTRVPSFIKALRSINVMPEDFYSYFSFEVILSSIYRFNKNVQK